MRILLPLTLAASPYVIAADYLSIEQAQRMIFATADEFREVILVPGDAQRESIVTIAGPQPMHRSLRTWRATRAGALIGYVFVDEVIGRQDMITYAIGLDAAGVMTPLEVLSYRESHGGEIRGSGWRNQFAGRRAPDALRFHTDIKNIAGATLSCEHVTQGVRWVAALWRTMLADAPVNPSIAR